MSDGKGSSLEAPFTFLLPMREDNPAFADFEELRWQVCKVIGDEYVSPKVTRLCTILAGNGISNGSGIYLRYAQQENGRWGSVRAITFQGDEERPLTIERLMKQRRIGPKTGQLLLDFILNLKVYSEDRMATSTG